MANLGPQKPKDTYNRLLQVPGWTNGVTPVALQLGDGTAVPLFVSNSVLRVGAAGADGVVQVWDDSAGAYVTVGGAGGADLSYTHDQSSPSATWTVVHNLGKNPSVSVVDSGGTVVVGTVTYVDADSLTVAFSGAFSGKAYLN